MAADPRWLEILKAGGGQAAAAAIACGLFLLAASKEWMPPPEPWMIHGAVFGLALFGLLAVVAVASAANRLFPVRVWFLHYYNRRQRKRLAEAYIPHMTPKEREIIGYLLNKNQKMFTAAHDGGYAVTLISRGIIIRALQGGQGFYQDDTPFAVPDEIWEVFVAHKDKFPYTRDDEEYVTHPWRRPF